MLRVGFSIILLAAWVAAAPASRSTADEQSAELKIKGSLTYQVSEALPSDSRAVVELHVKPELPKAPAIAQQRIDLSGKQSPVSFEFVVARPRLVAGATYVVRGAIVSGTRAILTFADVKIDASAEVADLGEVTLTPAKGPASESAAGTIRFTTTVRSR